MPVSQSATFGIHLRVLVCTIMYSDPTWFVGLPATEQCWFVSYTNYTVENHNVQPFFPDLTRVRPNKEMGGNLANWLVFSLWPVADG